MKETIKSFSEETEDIFDFIYSTNLVKKNIC
jgi:hypothetical protein